MDPNQIDLACVAAELRDVFRDNPPLGYVLGRTAFRDALVARHDWSQLDAEQIVDTMIARGVLRYEGDPTTAVDRPRPWSIATA